MPCDAHYPRPQRAAGPAPAGSRHTRTLAAPALGAVMIVLGAVGMTLAGCSLVTIKSPEKPLSTRDLNARILTNEYCAGFILAVAQAADAAAAATDDPAVRLNALKWKLGAAEAGQRAAGQIVPMMGLLDSWALALQMHAYFTTGAGRTQFGAQQPRVVTLAAALDSQVTQLARRLTTAAEFDHDQQFVRQYSQQHPLESLGFARPSIVADWALQSAPGTPLADSLGTVPEAMAEARDLVRMYGDNASDEALWKAQLAVQQSGISGTDVQTALTQINEQLERLSATADTAPDLVRTTVRDVQQHVAASWAEMLRALQAQGATLTDTVRSERAAAVAAVDSERVAAMADAARIESQAIRDAGREVRRVVREALLLIILLAVVVLGLPFAAGYLVGRSRRER